MGSFKIHIPNTKINRLTLLRNQVIDLNQYEQAFFIPSHYWEPLFTFMSASYY